MKLKVRADSKDWTIFGIFCGAWFIVIALLVVNINAFLNEETFTVNIFRIFTSLTMLGVTFLGFFAGIIFGLASVKSHFFDLEKGVGISSEEKKTKNYARWCKEKEMQSHANRHAINLAQQ